MYPLSKTPRTLINDAKEEKEKEKEKSHFWYCTAAKKA